MDRRQKMLLSTLLSVFLSSVCFLLVLAISNDNQKSWDLTVDKRHSFSPQTESLVSRLTQDVKLYAFVDPNGSTKEIEEILEKYRKLSPTHFHYEIVDLQKKPTLAETLQVKSYGQAVLERVEKDLPEGETPRRERVFGFEESTITNAITRLFRTSEKSVYFVVGHGERELGDDQNFGLSQLASSLRSEGYIAKPLHLIEAKSVPDDAALVVMAGPTGQLLDKEQSIIDAYLRESGKLFFWTDIKTPDSYVQWLSPYGVTLEKQLILDSESQAANAEPVIPIGQTYSPEHPITQRFAGITAFAMARPLILGEVTVEGLTGTTEGLVQTGENAFAVPLQDLLAGKEISFSSEGHVRARYTLAVAGKYTSTQAEPTEPSPSPTPDEPKAEESTRIIVSSSVNAFSNGFLTQAGNRDFCLNAINWLAESEDQITVRAKDPRVLPLSLAKRTQDWLYFIFCALIPFLSAFTGILIAYYRRKGEKL